MSISGISGEGLAPSKLDSNAGTTSELPSDDAKEGVASFVERRSAQFKGR